MRSELLNGGAYARAAFMAINQVATAGGAGDNTEVNSAWVDRFDNPNGEAMSVKVVIAYSAVLGAAETLTFAANLQDATDTAGAGAADFGTALAATTVVTAAGAATYTGVAELDFDLSGARKAVRLQATPNLSRANTDTLNWSVVGMLFGHQRNPVSNSLV